MAQRSELSILDQTRLSSLSERERQCLRLVSEHLGSKEIAKELGLSAHTVDGHLRSAIRKLELPTRREAARWLASIDPPPQRLSTETVSVDPDPPAVPSPLLRAPFDEIAPSVPRTLRDGMSGSKTWERAGNRMKAGAGDPSGQGAHDELEHSQVIPWIVRAVLLTLGTTILAVTGFEALNRVVFDFLSHHS